MTNKKPFNKIADGLNQAIGYTQGWNKALELAINISLAIDSGRGNEKLIAEAIKSRMLVGRNNTNA